MSKFNINDIYLDRIKQIDIDIKKAISKKNWGMKNLLEIEKKRINEFLNGSETKEEQIWTYIRKQNIYCTIIK